MYMFFWFFKQLFYILKKFTKHVFLLLFIFFIVFLLLRSKVFATYTFQSNVSGNNNTYTIPDLDTLPNEVLSSVQNYGYVIKYYNNSYSLFTPKTSNDFFFTAGNSSVRFKTEIYGINVVNGVWDPNGYYENRTPTGGITINYIVYYATDIYTDINKTNLWFNYTPPVENPFIENSITDIQNFTFDTLDINGGTIIKPEDSVDILVTYRDNLAPNIPSYREEYTIINNETSKTINGSIVIYHIPKSAIASPVIIRNGYYFYFSIVVRHPIERRNSNFTI